MNAPTHDEPTCDRKVGREYSNMLWDVEAATRGCGCSRRRSSIVSRRQRAHYAARIRRDANRGRGSSRVESGAAQCHAPTDTAVDAAVIHHRMAATHAHHSVAFSIKTLSSSSSGDRQTRGESTPAAAAQHRRLPTSRCMVTAAVQTGVDDRPARLRLY